MVKYLQLSLNLELARIQEQTVLSLVFHREAIRDFCLGLCLLKEGLVEMLTVTELPKAGAAKLQIVVEPQADERARTTFKSNAYRVALTPNNLNYLLRFFLKYYRDSVAEVDHIDLQAIDSETRDKEIYVVFEVPDSRPALSPEEAERLLG